MIIFVLALLGLVLGSFVNALVWRLHEQSLVRSTRSKAKDHKLRTNSLPNLSIWSGRSMCPNCRHELAAKDLVPVFSWLWLKGKCRYCHKTISWQYPAVELLTGLLFVFSYIFWPLTLNTQGVALLAFWLVFLAGFMALTVYDLKWMLLPDRILKPLTAIALAQAVFLLAIASSPVNQFLAIGYSVLIGGGLFYAIFQVSGGKWIGGGDVKLGGLLGLILANWQLALCTIFAASVFGSLVSLPMLATGKLKKTTKIPFGPFLIMGAIFAQLFGIAVIDWYKQKLLHY